MESPTDSRLDEISKMIQCSDPEKQRMAEEIIRWRRDFNAGTLVTVATPIPMRIYCSCGTLHIDEGEFATKLHKSHTCQSCGLTWQTALVPTVGVKFLPGTNNAESK